MTPPPWQTEVRGDEIWELVRQELRMEGEARTAGMQRPRLRCIVTCIGLNQKNQPNLDLYLVQRYKICHFPIVLSYLFIGQNQKNQPNLVLHLVRISKIFVLVATLAAAGRNQHLQTPVSSRESVVKALSGNATYFIFQYVNVLYSLRPLGSLRGIRGGSIPESLGLRSKM